MEEEYFYGIYDEERLHTDVQTAVENYLYSIDCMYVSDDFSEIPKYVDLNIYVETTVVSHNLLILDRMVEELEEEFGHPDHEFVISERLRNAEKKFEKILLEEYKPNACVYKKTEQLDLHEWITNWYSISLHSQQLTDAWEWFGM